MRYYRCSNGSFYSDEEIWERLEAGVWEVCCWDEATGEEWMASGEGRLLHLAPVDAGDVPAERSIGQIEG
ncbi:hypothetical protein [Halanaeroarchaeum sp. HSR-CO]|uniref:hypothetical protein n=1 Tax=Halanaeroarchaeum sp. HSR-CO TaxID=2866382 RepID=UPI00217D7977|nr:hypothetical protein [Halanaeroarchaeum sp. HSR-CO]